VFLKVRHRAQLVGYFVTRCKPPSCPGETAYSWGKRSRRAPGDDSGHRGPDGACVTKGFFQGRERLSQGMQPLEHGRGGREQVNRMIAHLASAPVDPGSSSKGVRHWARGWNSGVRFLGICRLFRDGGGQLDLTRHGGLRLDYLACPLSWAWRAVRLHSARAETDLDHAHLAETPSAIGGELCEGGGLRSRVLARAARSTGRFFTTFDSVETQGTDRLPQIGVRMAVTSWPAVVNLTMGLSMRHRQGQAKTLRAGVVFPHVSSIHRLSAGRRRAREQPLDPRRAGTVPVGRHWSSAIRRRSVGCPHR